MTPSHIRKSKENTLPDNLSSVWKFWIDVGGTFTDCLACGPDGREFTLKVLSNGNTKNRWKQSSSFKEFQDSALVGKANEFWKAYRITWHDENGAVVGAGEVIDSDTNGRIRVDSKAFAGATKSAVNYELTSPEPSPIFVVRCLLQLPLHQALPPIEMYLGTTRGTNALLTRRGARTAFVTTKGFGDLMEIGEQDRPSLFDLNIRKPRPLYETVAEIDERLAADGKVLKELDRFQTQRELRSLKDKGIESLAICFLHAFRFPEHERQAAEIARQVGFAEISLSSDVSPLIKIVPRAETTLLNAFLNPVIRQYADEIRERLSPGSQLQLMTSSGSLVSRDRFMGKDSVLSGPAGGVVGFSRAAAQAGFQRAIGFDMGGTSTDVARFDGECEKEFETRKAGVRIVTPVLAIETVAAGGGSICDFSGTRLTVGPDSASSDPGPACYGRGGPLAVTDINVFLGRISATHFPFALDEAAIERRLDELITKIQLSSGQKLSRVELALGFLKIANHNMASAVRTVSVARGYDPSEYLLVAFGGAGPQHATSVAQELGINKILVHPHSSLLSAAGIRWADRAAFRAQAILKNLDAQLLQELEVDFQRLEQQATADLIDEGAKRSQMVVKRSLDLRFAGTEPFWNIGLPKDGDYYRAFLEQHKRQFGYVQQRPVEVVAARVEVIVPGTRLAIAGRRPETRGPKAGARQDFYSGSTQMSAPRLDWNVLCPGDVITGPALIADGTTTVVVDAEWVAEMLDARQLLLQRSDAVAATSMKPKHLSIDRVDPIQLEIFSNSFMAIARQMGITLQRTSVSVNVKDRLDFSCAIFNAQGDLVVNAPHIPVHLGAMSETVRTVIKKNPDVVDGDVYVTNDPYAGGSHLPDVTVVTPIYVEERLAFWVASRGHHAEIGGKTPGSMPPSATCLADEGVLIQNLKLISAGIDRFDQLESLLLSGPYPSRNVPDNLADVRAQVAANRAGSLALQDLVRNYSLSVVTAYMEFVLNAAEFQVRAALRAIKDGRYSFSDAMDNGKRINVVIDKSQDQIRIDFSGTDSVSQDNLNANRAICMAAIMYTMRCLFKSEVPLNEGLVRPVSLVLPECFLNPKPGMDALHSPAIVGGNVETSQRIVDVLLGALELAAASQGTMNNWLMGDATFGYYETMGGGSGATSLGNGSDAVHTHMSNTRLTDPEVLETRYPVRLLEFRIANGTGGVGKYHGGNGMIRTVEFLKPLTVSLLTSRRNSRPYGLFGGGPGASGQNLLTRTGEPEVSLPSRCQVEVQVGDRLKIVTPGGGGWGTSG